MPSTDSGIALRPAVGRRTGPPVLIVPGAFSDIDSFERVIEWFSEAGRDAYALSLPQRDRRIPQVDSGGLAAHDRSLDRACSEIGEPVVAVGHSLGGLAVLRLLNRRRLPAAALLMPVPPGGLAADVFRLLRSQPVDAAKMLGISISAWPIRNLRASPPQGMFSRAAPRSAVDASVGRRVSESWRVLAEAFVGTGEPVAPVDTPLLLVSGLQDSIVSTQTVATLASDLEAPHLEFDVAHAFAEEPGFQTVLEAVDEQLRSYGA